MNADGSNPIRLTTHAAEETAPDFSPDGNKIVFNSDRDGNREIYLMNADGSSPFRVTNNSADDARPRWQRLSTTTILVSIDIKPGSFPNSVNPNNQGVIPLAILTTVSFDARTVDPATVRFGPKGAVEARSVRHLQDVDGDADLDLVLHFRTQATGIQCGDTSAALTGQTFDGRAIGGSDSINTVGCK